AGFAVIEPNRDFEAGRFAHVVFDRIACHGTEQPATDGCQHLTTTTTDRTAGHAAQRTAGQSTGPTASITLDHHIAHSLNRAKAYDLFALRLPVGIDGTRRA